MHRVIPLFFTLALAFTLTACDTTGAHDDEEEPTAEGFALDEGSFEATVRKGEESVNVSGGAVFGFATNLEEDDLPLGSSGSEGFVVYMLDGERTPESERTVPSSDTWTDMQIAGAASELPEEGTYDADQGNDYRLRVTSYPVGVIRSFGTPDAITITSVSDDELKGTFSYESLANPPLEVEGTFTAVRADDIDAVLCAPECDEE